MSLTNTEAMQRALRLAANGLYTTEPNPRVGCVLTKGNKVIAQGYHRKAGEPHAERVALANASESPSGTTAYVTLEPCCHFGKTPPCTEGLIEAGIARVIIAMQDPNPLVAGKGIKALEAAGMVVQCGLLGSQAEALNRGFIKRMQAGRPFVRCKLASSLDGRTAMANGESIWISSAASRRDVQFLRAESSAILTGLGTILSDDPSMNVRLDAAELSLDPGLSVLQPLRVILDARLQTPITAKIFSLPGEVLLFCAHDVVSQAVKYSHQNVTVSSVDCTSDAGGDRLNLEQVMQVLSDRQVNDILLETGATLAGSMLDAGLVDELIVYQAPHLMGDLARGLLHLPYINNMDERIGLEITDSRKIGADMRITASIKH